MLTGTPRRLARRGRSLHHMRVVSLHEDEIGATALAVIARCARAQALKVRGR